MKEKNLLKIQPLPKVLSMQAVRSKQLREHIYRYICESNFITGQNERQETTQNTTVTKSAAVQAIKTTA
jgi:hypothetical protein